MANPKISLPPIDEFTEEVRKAICDKLEEMEGGDITPGQNVQINPPTVMWGVSYDT